MKTILTIILIAICVMLAIQLKFSYDNREYNNTHDYSKEIKHIDSSIDSIFRLNERVISKDDSFKNVVVNITNNYKSIYEKTNDSTFNDFVPVINLLLKRHNEIKFERNY